MEINSFERSGMFELTGKLPESPRVFKVINPFFFNFLKRTNEIDEIIEALPGVTVEWAADHRQPLVKLDNFPINEEAQLFYQLYNDQMVELEV